MTKQQPPISRRASSIKTFCREHEISESFYFKLKNRGLGPDEMHVGNKVLITDEAAKAWRAAREAASPQRPRKSAAAADTQREPA